MVCFVIEPADGPVHSISKFQRFTLNLRFNPCKDIAGITDHEIDSLEEIILLSSVNKINLPSINSLLNTASPSVTLNDDSATVWDINSSVIRKEMAALNLTQLDDHDQITSVLPNLDIEKSYKAILKHNLASEENIENFLKERFPEKVHDLYNLDALLSDTILMDQSGKKSHLNLSSS